MSLSMRMCVEIKKEQNRDAAEERSGASLKLALCFDFFFNFFFKRAVSLINCLNNLDIQLSEHFRIPSQSLYFGMDLSGRLCSHLK